MNLRKRMIFNRIVESIILYIVIRNRILIGDLDLMKIIEKTMQNADWQKKCKFSIFHVTLSNNFRFLLLKNSIFFYWNYRQESSHVNFVWTNRMNERIDGMILE